MSTSMERQYWVRSLSLPPSPNQPGRSLLPSPKAKRRDRHRGGRIRCLRWCHNHARPHQWEVNFWKDEKLDTPHSRLKRPRLWGCSMVHKGKNIANGSKNPQFPPVMCAPCPRRARTVHKRPLGCLGRCNTIYPCPCWSAWWLWKSSLQSCGGCLTPPLPGTTMMSLPKRYRLRPMACLFQFRAIQGVQGLRRQLAAPTPNLPPSPLWITRFTAQHYTPRETPQNLQNMVGAPTGQT